MSMHVWRNKRIKLGDKFKVACGKKGHIVILRPKEKAIIVKNLTCDTPKPVLENLKDLTYEVIVEKPKFILAVAKGRIDLGYEDKEENGVSFYIRKYYKVTDNGVFVREKADRYWIYDKEYIYTDSKRIDKLYNEIKKALEDASKLTNDEEAKLDIAGLLLALRNELHTSFISEIPVVRAPKPNVCRVARKYGLPIPCAPEESKLVADYMIWWCDYLNEYDIRGEKTRYVIDFLCKIAR